MLMQINHWWFSLEQRERSLLKIMGAFLLVVLFYLLIWLPVKQANIDAEKRLANAQQEWQWLNEQVPRVEQSLKAGGSIKTLEVKTQNQLLTLLQSTLLKENLFKDIKTVKGITNGGEVSFDAVSASRFLRWLGTLEQQGVLSHELKMEWLGVDQVRAKVEFKLP